MSPALRLPSLSLTGFSAERGVKKAFSATQFCYILIPTPRCESAVQPGLAGQSGIPLNAPLLADSALFDFIADQIATSGLVVLPEFLPAPLTEGLYHRVTKLDEQDVLARAGIGRQQDFQLNQKVRRDATRWLRDENPLDQQYLQWMNALREGLNQRLFMGLFDYEAHYAHYAPGAFYKRHMDAFKGQNQRVLTTVLYLNRDWQADGGALSIYAPDSDAMIKQVTPEMGTFVMFLSEQFPHEVLTAQRDRYSIAGWFRLRDDLRTVVA